MGGTATVRGEGGGHCYCEAWLVHLIPAYPPPPTSAKTGSPSLSPLFSAASVDRSATVPDTGQVGKGVRKEEEKVHMCQTVWHEGSNQCLHAWYLPLQECSTLQVGEGIFLLPEEGPSDSPLHKKPARGRDGVHVTHMYTHAHMHTHAH